jgi:predicted aspartyl protease
VTFGYVKRNLDPIVAVFVVGDNGHRWRQEAVVDTGFNGNLTMPAGTIQEVGLRLYGLIAVTLADEQTNLHNHYDATVLWEGGERTDHVMESADQFLPGTNLFPGRMLTVQMSEGGHVVIA